jgi:4-hydroxybenzoate polyprenyltransferase
VSGRRSGGGVRAWAELLRLPALFSVPGDALAGAAAVGARPNARTLLGLGCSLCLYEAGMALNDWADRADDALERPGRPIPSGRVRPVAALAAAGALTAGGLALAARAGRSALAVAIPLAAVVWAYDLGLKRTSAGPAVMAAARGLDLLLGAGATADDAHRAVRPAVALGAHTLAVTVVSRHEVRGGSPWAPLGALAITGALAAVEIRSAQGTWRTPSPSPVPRSKALLQAGMGVAYAATAGRPYVHAVLNPSPALTQRAVSGGIRATILLQAALCAHSGASKTAAVTAALAPVARGFARRVSIT